MPPIASSEYVLQAKPQGCAFTPPRALVLDVSCADPSNESVLLGVAVTRPGALAGVLGEASSRDPPTMVLEGAKA